MMIFLEIQNKQKANAAFSAVMSSYVPLHPDGLHKDNYIRSFSQGLLVSVFSAGNDHFKID